MIGQKEAADAVQCLIMSACVRVLFNELCRVASMLTLECAGTPP